jgi:hypothetical protein
MDPYWARLGEGLSGRASSQALYLAAATIPGDGDGHENGDGAHPPVFSILPRWVVRGAP